MNTANWKYDDNSKPKEKVYTLVFNAFLKNFFGVSSFACEEALKFGKVDKTTEESQENSFVNDKIDVFLKIYSILFTGLCNKCWKKWIV